MDVTLMLLLLLLLLPLLLLFSHRVALLAEQRRDLCFDVSAPCRRTTLRQWRWHYPPHLPISL
jgi:hypothetical protein